MGTSLGFLAQKSVLSSDIGSVWSGRPQAENRSKRNIGLISNYVREHRILVSRRGTFFQVYRGCSNFSFINTRVCGYCSNRANRVVQSVCHATWRQFFFFTKRLSVGTTFSRVLLRHLFTLCLVVCCSCISNIPHQHLDGSTHTGI